MFMMTSLDQPFVCNCELNFKKDMYILGENNSIFFVCAGERINSGRSEGKIIIIPIFTIGISKN